MRTKPITNVPASIHARPLNLARGRGTQLNFPPVLCHGPTLRKAVEHTFGIRGTVLGNEVPALLEASFSGEERERLWAGFLTNALLFADGPGVLSDVGDRIRSFLGPVHSRIVRSEPFRRNWLPGGPWRLIGGEEGADTSE